MNTFDADKFGESPFGFKDVGHPVDTPYGTNKLPNLPVAQPMNIKLAGNQCSDMGLPANVDSVLEGNMVKSEVFGAVREVGGGTRSLVPLDSPKFGDNPFNKLT